MYIQGGPGRSGQTLGSYRKFNSEQKISYKHGSENASLRSYRSKISQIVIILHIFPNIMEEISFFTSLYYSFSTVARYFNFKKIILFLLKKDFYFLIFSSFFQIIY